MTIIREQTSAEKVDFINLMEKDVAKRNFYTEKDKHMQEAMQKGIKLSGMSLPFAEKAAIDDFYDYYKRQLELSERRFGYPNLAEIKPINQDWKKYSDLNNFDLVDEGEISDGNLTKNNPGLDVKIAYKKFKFKGYSNIYECHEDATHAILRARAKLRDIESDTKKK